MMQNLINIAINLDEVSDDLKISTDFLKRNDVEFAEIRTINGRNIIDYELEEIKSIKKYMGTNGLKISALASPLFKWFFRERKNQSPKHDGYFFESNLNLEQKKKYLIKALDIADTLETSNIRIFSNLKQPGISKKFFWNDELFEFLIVNAEKRKTNILLENEPVCLIFMKKDYLEVFRKFSNKHFKAWIDIANFYQVGEVVDSTFISNLLPYLGYLHIKDLESDKSTKYVPLGDGFINYKRIFSDLNLLLQEPIFAGIETHVKVNKQEATKRSLDSLRSILSTKRIKYGLVGAGRISHAHEIAFKENANSEIRGVYDINSSKSRIFAKRNDVQAYKSLNTMLGDEMVDVINICTPHDTHIRIAQKVIKSNKVVLSEKPFALTTKQLASYLEGNKSKDNTYVVFQNLYNNPVTDFIEACKKGDFGEVQFFAVNIRWWRNNEYFNDWHGRKNQAGGSLYTQAIHSIQLLSKVTSLSLPNKKVQSIRKTFRSHSQVEDVGVYLVELENGAIGYIELCLVTKQQDLESSIFIVFSKGAIKIGGLALSNLEYSYFGKAEMLPHDEKRGKANYYGRGHSKLIQSLSDKLLGNNNPLSNYLVKAVDIYQVIRFIENIYCNLG